jgi:intraflagellar transport protein 88
MFGLFNLKIFCRFDWCVTTVKQSSYPDLSAELEITKAIAFLKMREFKTALEILKSFEKRGSKMESTAATNLAFLYFLEKQFAQANKCV